MQNQYNLLRRQDEREMMAMCADMGVGLVPYSPQGKGRLARPWGEQIQPAPPSTRSSRPSTRRWTSRSSNAVQQLAEARGVTMAQIALAWVLRKPVVSAPIVGATKTAPPARSRRRARDRADRRRGRRRSRSPTAITARPGTDRPIALARRNNSARPRHEGAQRSAHPSTP